MPPLHTGTAPPGQGLGHAGREGVWGGCTALLTPSTLSTVPAAPAGLCPSTSRELLCWRSSALQGWNPAASQATPQRGKALWIHHSLLEFAGWWTWKFSCRCILTLSTSSDLFFILDNICTHITDSVKTPWFLFSYPFWIRLSCKQFLFQSNTAS